MTRHLFPAAIALMFVSLFADSSPWEINVDANVTVALATYSDSWTGDETGNFSWASHLLLEAFKQLHENLRTENTLKMEFGQSKNQDKETDKWSRFMVSTDLIDFTNIEKLTMKWLVDPYVGFRVQTQFFNGIPENNKVKYLNPVILSESFGASRLFIDNSYQKLDIRLGGVIYERFNRKIETTQDGGVEIVANYSLNSKENYVTYTTYLNLYQAVTSSIKENDKWKAIDIDWRNSLSMNVTKYIMINYMYQLLYDRNISEKVRSRQTLSLGLTFKYNNKKAEE